ncbi:magnesium transporter [Zobellella denitrificans]|jgi:magnesium transporter|uniref:Magnesium transporter MgtE n=1 Tax=Zobellella denitrificans TaxID=347534 RepID=A0A231N0C9_9GAMM|nr:magnesium transporter [Zobellella denitrificans]ATG75255.1 magnesium transporter [Zobellella denitrificans]OXS15832.1 magnesium transporter [Zobellella denitrificans]
MTEPLDHPRTPDQLDSITQALNSGMFVHVRRMLQQMRPGDVAWLLESSPSPSRKVLWQLIDPDDYGEILEELSEEVRDGIIRLMDPDKLAIALEDMESDDLAYVLRDLPEQLFSQVLDRMDEQDRQRAEQALSYAEDTAGSLMNTEFITLRPDVTIDVVLRYLRRHSELPDGTDTLYVVDQHNRLLGDMPLASLVVQAPTATVAEVMDTSVEAIPLTMSDTEVANLFERHDWLSAPVVDEERRLLGRITIDDVVDIIREEGEHSMMGMAKMADDEDTFAPVLTSARRRSVWLTVNLGTALAAASVSNMFEATLDQLATLAILMTIVPSMGGIAGNQTLALVIRGMAVGHIGDSNARWLLTKEAMVGLINGMLWALMIAVVVSLWKDSWQIGLVIAAAMFINLSVAGMAGAMIPLAMRKLNIDPALAGSMALTTITDIVGLLSFLGLATLILLN